MHGTASRRFSIGERHGSCFYHPAKMVVGRCCFFAVPRLAVVGPEKWLVPKPLWSFYARASSAFHCIRIVCPWVLCQAGGPGSFPDAPGQSDPFPSVFLRRRGLLHTSSISRIGLFQGWLRLQCFSSAHRRNR